MTTGLIQTDPTAPESASPSRPKPVTPAEVCALVGLLAVFAATVGWLLAAERALSHDEAAYAIQARSWLRDMAETGVAVHRAPAASVLALPVLLFTTTEGLLRVVGLLSALGGLVTVWWLGRMLAGRATGLLAPLFAASVPLVQEHAQYLLTDLPNAVLLVLCVAVLWRELEVKPRPSWGLLAVAPLAALAFYFRYGTPLALVVIAAVTVLVWAPTLWRARTKVGATAGLFLVLLVPHFARSVAQFGSPLERMLQVTGGQVVAGDYFLGSGLVELARRLVAEPDGLVLLVLFVVGLGAGGLGAVRGMAKRGPDRQVRAWALASGTAGLYVLAMALSIEPNLRYFMFAVLLCCVAAAKAVVNMRGWAARFGTPLGVAVVVVAVLASVGAGSGAFGYRLAHRYENVDEVNSIRAAGRDINAAADGSCSILSSYVPHLTWYANCQTYAFGWGFKPPPQPGRELLLHGDARFMYLYRGGKRQPEGELLDYYLSRARPEPFAVYPGPDSPPPQGVVYRMPP